MKIAYILPNLQRTGPIIVVSSLVKYLVDKVDKIDVFYLDECKSPINFDCPVHKISYLKAINFNGYNIIHSHTAKADLYCFIWKWKIKHSKVITTIHQDTFITEMYRLGNLCGRVYTRIWLRVQNNFEYIVAISKQVKDAYQKYFSKNIQIIYNGVDCGHCILDNTILESIRKFCTKKSVILGTCAFITERKGLLQVLDMITKHDGYKFVIIGDGPNKQELIDYSIKHSIENKVLFIPHVECPYLYLKDIDIYMMPSYSEGFGLAMVEAALQHKAVVCSNLPSFHEIFPNDEVAFFNLNEVCSMKKAVDFIYNNLDEYSTRCHDRAEKCFLAENMADNYLKLYQQAIHL